MSPAVRIALIGFTAFERTHIEAALQSTDESDPRYLLSEDLAACSAAVVNADDETAVQRVHQHGRLASTVMLGTTPRPGAAAHLNRPISLVLLLRALNELLRSMPPMSAAVQRVHEDLARMRGPGPAPAALPTAGGAASPIIQGPRSEAARHATQAVLVVDDQDLVLRFMARHLPPLGCDVQLVRSGARAVERAARQPFACVFLATGLDGMDSFHTCKTLKRMTYPDGRPAPTVVMLLDQDLAVERLRAEMAGADACLSKPLDPADLRQVLGPHLAATAAAALAEAPTTRATSSQH